MSIKREGGGQDKGNMGDAMEDAGVGQTPGGAAPGGGAGQRSAGAGGQAGIMNMNSLMRRPMSRSSAGESVVRYGEVLRKILKAETQELPEDMFRVFIFDSSNNMVALSSILILYRQQRGGQEHIAVYTLMIEASASGRLSNRQLNIGGQNVEVETVPGDVFDDQYWDRVTKYVNDQVNTNANVHYAGVFVIPSEMDSADEERMRQVLFNATTALVTVMDNALGDLEDRFTIGQISNRDNLTARVDYSTVNDENPAGLPRRADVSITLQAVINAGGQGQYEQAMDVTKVDGFVDLVYDASTPQQHMGQVPPQQMQFAQQQQQQTQRYYPRVVLTDLDTEINAITMELQLLGLSTSTLLSRGMAWGGVFHPNYNASSPDLRDIGALGYEINFTGDPNSEPERIDTKAENFSRENLYQLLQFAIHDAPIYSMDIEETGELSWIHGAFVAAARGAPDARAVIVEAADKLTMGYFSQYFGNEPIAMDDYNRIHLGYYEPGDGRRHDLREIDYLAMLNMVGGKDMRSVIEFSETFDRTDIPVEIRLERRARLLRAVLGDSMKIKGYAQRITFNPNFIIALQTACAAAGLTIRPGNVAQDFGSLGVRGNAAAAGQAVSGMTGSLWQSGQPQWGGYRQTPSFFGRWGR